MTKTTAGFLVPCWWRTPPLFLEERIITTLPREWGPGGGEFPMIQVI
jgi:hypothetical protein